MAAILQVIGDWLLVDRAMQPWFTVHFFNIARGHPCYDQSTPVKTRYLLSSITSSNLGLKSASHRGHLFF